MRTLYTLSAIALMLIACVVVSWFMINKYQPELSYDINGYMEGSGYVHSEIK